MAGNAILPDETIAFLLVTGLCSGMSIITCGFAIISLGPSFKLTGDRHRQQFLAIVSFLAAVFGLVGNGLQQGRLGTSVGDKIASFFFNWLVQLGLAGIAHTSVIRLLTAILTSPAPEMLSRATRLCCVFYFLTLPALTPTFIALVQPSRTEVKAVARNLNIAIICAVELLATVADFMLLKRFTQGKENGVTVRMQMIRDMWSVYVAIWLSVCVDIVAKIYRDRTSALVPDLAITNLTLTLRVMAALMYGTTVRNAREIYSLQSFAWGSSVSGQKRLVSNPGAAHGHNRVRSGLVAPGTYKMGSITVTTETHTNHDHEGSYYEGSKGYESSG